MASKMPQNMSRLQLSSQLLASTLLLHYFFTEVRADTSNGSDAPGPSPNNGGPTTAYNDAGASGSNGGLSVTAQIVIGVVVGGVGLAAIIGAIIFFIRKKRNLDDKIKRYENITAYQKAQRDEKRQQAISLRQQRRQRQQDLEQGMLEITTFSKDQTRDSVVPKYDPSSFHRHQYSLDSSRGLSIDMPREPLINQHHRHSSSLSSNMTTIPPPPAQKSGFMNQNHSRDTASLEKQPAVVASEQHIGSLKSDTRPREVKKPKPALTRLITNL